MSTLAFAAADWIEHTVFGGDRKSPVILLAGVLLHAVAGVLATLTWHHYREVVHRVWAMTGPLVATTHARLRPADTSARVPRRHLLGSCLTSRAPPVNNFV